MCSGTSSSDISSPQITNSEVAAERLTAERQGASNQDLHILWPFGRKVGDELPGEMRLLQLCLSVASTAVAAAASQKMSQMLKVDGALRDHWN